MNNTRIKITKTWRELLFSQYTWQKVFNVNETKYEYTSDGGNKYRIFISKYRNTNEILINGYHPGLGNSSQWQTEFIQEYMKNY